MKKTLILFFVTTLLGFSNFAFADVNVLVGGELVLFSDEVPYIDQNGRTLVPVRFVAEKVGANVNWDSVSRSVYIEKDANKIILEVDNCKVTKYKEDTMTTFELDTKPVLSNLGRVMVPLRFMSESFGLYVHWIWETQSVFISSSLKDSENPLKGRLYDVLLATGDYEQAYPEALIENFMKPKDNNAHFIVEKKKPAIINEIPVLYFDTIIHMSEFDLYTRHKVRDILKIAYPTGYDTVYDYLMKTLREEIALTCDAQSDRAGIDSKYFNGRGMALAKSKYTSCEIYVGMYGAEQRYNKQRIESLHLNFAPNPFIQEQIQQYDLDTP